MPIHFRFNYKAYEILTSEHDFLLNQLICPAESGEINSKE